LGGADINTSGSQSGTHTLNTESFLLQSSTTPQGLVINVRLKDNRGSCVQFSIENTAGTIVGGSDTTHGGNLIPAASKTFRIIGCKYQFFIFVPAVNNTSRNYVAAGVPYIPSPNSVPANAGWMLCDSISDTDGTVRGHIRINVSTRINFCPNSQAIWASSI